MTINMNTAKLVEIGLTPDLYILLLYLVKGISNPFKYMIRPNLVYLQQGDWIRSTVEGGIVPTDKTMELIGENVQSEDPDLWIDEWRELWPTGVKSGGQPIKGDKKSCTKKMKAFCKENPKILKEQIMEATKIYLFEKERDRWTYTKCAHYFIDKDKISLLASLVEDLEGKEMKLKELKKINPKATGGDDGWFKVIN